MTIVFFHIEAKNNYLYLYVVVLFFILLGFYQIPFSLISLYLFLCENNLNVQFKEQRQLKN